MKPWHLKIHGPEIHVGRSVHVVCTKDRNVRLCVWEHGEQIGHIKIGDYALICPGVRIDSASHIDIGDNCMIASSSYLTDADWHDIYDRTQPIGNTKPIKLEPNVWIGDSCIVCKGVTIGENSVIGSGSVVTHDIPANVIAAGNPAKVVKKLDPEEEIVTREALLADHQSLMHSVDQLNRAFLKDNTILGWLRTVVKPRTGD
jgi:acetyltransferase-like isoleucine patch superfamily enzyme